jgi:formate hydrogenlyase subunit 3/multisubunit Na+/H+ antiporter MnhD subunit
MTASASLLVLPIAVPLGAAFLMPVAANVDHRLARWLGLGALLAALAITIGLAGDIFAGGPLTAAMGGFKAPLGIVLVADRLAILLVIALQLAGLMFWGGGTVSDPRTDALLVLLTGAGTGLALSGDLFNVFVFYEITAVASYGLVAGAGTGAAIAAALRYLIVGALGSSLILLGIALVYGLTGTLNLADIARLAPQRLEGAGGLTAFLLLVLGFGVKAELVPVNTWVPEVYGTASARVSALLAGVVSKLAIVVILRLVVLAFPVERAHELLLLLGMAGVVIGELAALTSTTLAQALAYSSIAQLGLVAIAFSISGTAGIAAGLALAAHHAVVKPAFFALAEGWRGQIAGLTGAARRAPLGGAVLVLLVLSIIGLPPLPGFWAKYLLLTAAFAAAKPVVTLAAILVLAAVVVEAAYLLRIVAVAYTPDAKADVAALSTGHAVRAGLLAAALVVAMVYTTPLIEWTRAIAVEAGDAKSYVARVLPHAQAADAGSVKRGGTP